MSYSDAVSKVFKDLLGQNQGSFIQKHVPYFSSAFGYFLLETLFTDPVCFYSSSFHIFLNSLPSILTFWPHNKIPQDSVLLLYLLAALVEVIT